MVSGKGQLAAGTAAVAATSRQTARPVKAATTATAIPTTGPTTANPAAAVYDRPDGDRGCFPTEKRFGPEAC